MSILKYTLKSKGYFLSILVLLMSIARIDAQTTVTLPASVDAEIFSKDPAKNYGNCDILWVGPEGDKKDFSRSLILFDLSSIPACAVIYTAYLQLTTVSGGDDSDNPTIGAYRITNAWTEGNGDCGGNSGNDVTWNFRTTSTNWGTGGGTFNSTAESSTTISKTAGITYGWNLKSLVAGWINGTYTNYGVILKYVNENQNKTYGAFASSEHTTIASRPRLVVSYHIPLTATVTVTNITSAAAGDGVITISSPSGAPSNTYQYQLNSSAWQNSGTFDNLDAGSYEVKIRDAVSSNCEKSLGTFKIIGGSDLAVSSTYVATSTPLTDADSVTFTVKVHNNGPFDATGVKLTELLPSQLTFISSSTTQGTYNSLNGEWNIGALDSGDTVTLIVSAKVSQYGSFSVSSSITASSEGDSVSGNNSVTHEFLAQRYFEAGACIVNLGLTSSANAGLKPYGLVFDLVRNYKVPVYWAINPNKTFGSTNT